MTEATQEAEVLAPTSHTFSNGDTLNFSVKQKMKKDIQVAEDGESVTVSFMFRNGAEQNITMAADHKLFMTLAGFGISQKVGDAAAGTESVEDAVEAIKRTIKQVEEGEWTVRRPASGGGSLSILVEAIMAVKGIEQAEASDLISALPEAKLAQLKSLSVVQTAIAEVRLKRMEAKIAADKAKEPEAEEVSLDDII